MSDYTTMKPTEDFLKCRNCGMGTKKLYEVDIPIRNKTVLPIYAVCYACLKKITDKGKKK